MRTLIGLFLSVAVLSGCQTLDAANQGAKSVGHTTGKILTLPDSINEGMTDARKGPDGPNPYNR